MLNIAINAHDAMPAGGTLTIETRAVDLPAGEAEATSALPPGRYASLTMADNGSGMDEVTRARIFEPFFTTKGLGKGTGLGLSTAYGIVTQCGGDIAVESAPGQGTTFRIYLPLVDAEPSLARSQTPQPAVARGTETILVVDDEPGLVTVAQRALTFAGYTVLTATGGEDALRVLAAHDGRVGLVVTDVVIPGISGLELAERITRDYPGTRILYSSGYTDDAVLRRGVESSRTHFIGKPYTLTDLTRKVREMLDGSVSE